MGKVVCVINQCTFIPWMGYLSSLDYCDVYIPYDNVQFDGHSWQQRNKIRNGDSWMWLTIPVVRKHGQLINEVRINNSINWQKSHWKSIIQEYGNASYFGQYKAGFQRIYESHWEKLMDLNLALLLELSKGLNIKLPKIIMASEIQTEGHKTERLIPILKAVRAEVFLEGPAGKDYMNIKMMNDAGIKVFWWEYKHPTYPQNGKEFIPYLSSLDLLFNTGDKAIEYIRQGVNLVKANAN